MHKVPQVVAMLSPSGKVETNGDLPSCNAPELNEQLVTRPSDSGALEEEGIKKVGRVAHKVATCGCSATQRPNVQYTVMKEGGLCLQVTEKRRRSFCPAMTSPQHNDATHLPSLYLRGRENSRGGFGCRGLGIHSLTHV